MRIDLSTEMARSPIPDHFRVWDCSICIEYDYLGNACNRCAAKLTVDINEDSWLR